MSRFSTVNDGTGAKPGQKERPDGNANACRISDELGEAKLGSRNGVAGQSGPMDAASPSLRALGLQVLPRSWTD